MVNRRLDAYGVEVVRHSLHDLFLVFRRLKGFLAFLMLGYLILKAEADVRVRRVKPAVVIRRTLDLLRTEYGITVSQLCSIFRVCTLKHITHN